MGKRLQILIIDDEPQVREMLKNFLVRKDYYVETADNGAVGWEKFNEAPDRFDLIISDIKMPELDGIALLEKIRREQHDIPVVMMTGYADMDYTLKALRFGALDFFTKPFEWESLLESIRKLESLHADQQQILETLPFQNARISVSAPSQTRLVKGVISGLTMHYKEYCNLFKIDSNKISLCLLEAVMNAVIHGNLEVDSSLKEGSWDDFREMISKRESMSEYANRQVNISTQFQGNRIEFEVTDEGKGFDQKKLPNMQSPESLLSSGRGLLIIHSYMDEISWNDAGNSIKMVKYVNYS